MPRLEVSTSMHLNNVQNDNYWRDRYRHDDIRDKKWLDKPKKRRGSSFKVMPVAPQLRPVERSTSQSQMTVGGRRSSYEWSVPARRQPQAKVAPHLVKKPPPLKQTKGSYISPQQQGGRYGVSPSMSRTGSSLNLGATKYIVPEGLSTVPSCQTSPSLTRATSSVGGATARQQQRLGAYESSSPATSRSPYKSHPQAGLTANSKSFVSDFSNIGRNTIKRSPFRR